MSNFAYPGEYLGRNLIIYTESPSYIPGNLEFDVESELGFPIEEGVVKEGVVYTLSFDALSFSGEVEVGEMIIKITKEGHHSYPILIKSPVTSIIFRGSGKVWRIKFEEELDETPWCLSREESILSPNLISGTSSQWSPWISPLYDMSDNPTYSPFFGEFSGGYGVYSYTVELQFRDVKSTDDQESSFYIYGRGEKSGWGKTPISGEAKIDGVPEENRIYRFQGNTRYDFGEDKFKHGFICSFWKSGQFRFRKMAVKSENYPNPLWSKSEEDRRGL